MSDSRVEKLATQFEKDWNETTSSIRLVDRGWFTREAGRSVAVYEVAGLIVIDPDDPEVIERVAREIDAPAWDGTTPPRVTDWARGNSLTIARAVLSAMRGDR